MANGDLVKLGTLYMGGTKVIRPTIPWDNAGQPYTGAGNGNISNFTAGATLEIRDTSATEADQIYWREVTDGSKKLLVADRNLLVNISWNDLNAQNLITGKTITINGQQYLVRSMTGGSNYRSGSDAYSGGSPSTNEWDRIITNESNFAGLPLPVATDLDTTQNATDKNSTHNQFWNWLGVYSWTQEIYTSDSAYRSNRGFNSARNWGVTSASYRFSSVGWRPVLEVLNAAPVISGSDSSLGNKAAPFVQSFTVTDPDAGNTFSVVVKLNGVTKSSLTNQVNGSFSYDLTPDWSGLALGTHTLTVTATDAVGAASTRTWTFVKTNSPATAPTITKPSNNQRTIAQPTIEFTIASDAEGDTQTFKVQIANDAAFTTGLVEQTTGFELNSTGTTWIPLTSATNAMSGKTARVKLSAGLPLNVVRYARIVSSDSGSGVAAPSTSIVIKIGDQLDIKTFPDIVSFQPKKVMVLLQKDVDLLATLQVFVTNNALDATPTWEECTAQVLSGSPYSFVNAVKVNADWAVSVRVVIKANTAIGNIKVNAIGVGVS
ncbi:Ig-like domain-containing protein [Exiguobacterium sp. S22-S28]|uniref:Ig-like domain-containing protein n=1 Tax=Exiguobacterium sp. S22-S28 TaxID=3342768 RepID=UPI00372D6061